MSSRQILCRMAALAVFVSAGFVQAAEPAATPSLDQVITGIAAAEHKMVNLKVQSGSLWSQERSAGSVEWKPAAIGAQVSGWYNGLRNSKARLEVKDIVLPWNKGAAALSQQSYTAGFDGQYGRLALHTSGAVGKTADYKRGEISSQAPGQLEYPETQVAAGTALSVYLYSDGTDKPLSERLREIAGAQASSPGSEVRVEADSRDTGPCVRITAGRPGVVEETWWVDPSKGYALLGHKHVFYDKDGTCIVSVDDQVTRLVEAAPGIWYPVEGSRTQPSGDLTSGKARRLNFRIEKAIANDPQFDESVFRVDFPPGYFITDKVSGVAYKSGLATAQLEPVLQDVAGAIISASSQPATITPTELAAAHVRPVAAGQALVATDAVARAPGRLGWSWLLLAGGTVVLTAVVLLRQRRSRLPYLLVLAAGLLVLQLPARAESGPESATNNTLDSRSNCAVNVGYVTLRLLDRPVPLIKVVADLRAGEHLERLCSLGDLKRLFEGNGLTVRGLKAGTPAEILDLAGPRSVLVFRIQARVANRDVGHFMLLRAVADGFLLVDPPEKPLRLGRDALLAHKTMKAASGELLVIEPPGPSRTGPAVLVEDPQTDLGEIPAGTQTIPAEIRLRNCGTEPLEIRYVGASCSCVGEFSGDRTIGPGASGVLRFTFERNRLPAGLVMRGIDLLTNDPAHEKVNVEFQMRLPEELPPAELALQPTIIDYGRLTSAATIGKPVTVRLVIPDAIGADGKEVRVEADESRLEVRRVSESRTAAPGGRPARAIEYRICWRETPQAGAFAERVGFEVGTPDGKTRQAALQLRGDLVAWR